MDKMLEKAFEYVESHRDEAIAMYRDMINTKSYAREPEGVVKMAHLLKGMLVAEGFECKLIDVGTNGPTLVGVLGADRPGKPIIFSGHMDTVLSNDTYPDEPFRIEDGKAYGPGVLDMKGGLSIALNTVKALNYAGWAERPIKFLISGDEEINHTGSKGAKVFEEEARGGLCAFNLETSPVNNCLCVFRKGNTRFNITVEGREVHAGNDYEKGINAIDEMAFKIIDLRAMTNMEIGTTINCGVIKGGTVSNAVPKHCEMEVDMRFCSVEEMNKAKAKAEELAMRTHVVGTKTSFRYLNIMDVFEETSEGYRFYEFISKVSEEIGMGSIPAVRLGGGSDAAYTTMAGVPTVCSCGIRGEWNHTTREYAVVESLFERSKLYAAVVMRIGEFVKE